MVSPRELSNLEVLSDDRNSTIVKALDRRTGKMYALKMCVRDASGIACHSSYISEKRTLDTLPPHPNIIGYYRSCEDDNTCLILEYFDGATMQELIYRSGNHLGLMDRKRIKSYLRQIVSGVKHMHSSGVYHCDLKPDNVLVSQDSVRIIDFGCSIISSTGIMAAKDLPSLGTPGFMPPEASDLTYTGEVRLRDLDVWAFGCILYYSYTRNVPFVEGFAFDTLRNVRNISIDLSVLPKDVKHILKRIFIHDPSSRYTVEELEGAVEGLHE